MRCCPPFRCARIAAARASGWSVLLKSFGAAELTDMREPDGGVTVTCEYCTTQYRFSPDEVGRL